MDFLDGSQLDLFEGTRHAVNRVPWAGRSPRDLTRGAKLLFLRREPQKSVSDPVSPLQLEMWPSWPKNAPRKYRGAPLLIEPRRR